MLHHAIHGFRRIAARARLKKEMPGRKLLISSNVLPLIHHLHFIHMSNFQLCPLFGRASHPVYIVRQRTGTVCFNADILSCLVQAVHKVTVNPKGGFASCQYHGSGRVLSDLLQNLLIGHQSPLLMLRITKGALQVTTGKTDKDSRGTRMVSFSLQTVEYLINLPHRRQCLIPTPAPLP